MRPLNHRLGIHHVRTAKQNLGYRHQQRGLVDGRQQLLQIDAHRVRRLDQLDARAEPSLLVIEVLNRGKLKVHHHDFVSGSAEVEARSDHRLGRGHVLMQRDLARPRSDQRRNQVGGTRAQLPPTLLPCAHAALRPAIRIRPQAVIDFARHCAERIADQIRRSLEDRKFAPPLQQLIHCVHLETCFIPRVRKSPPAHSSSAPSSRQRSTPSRTAATVLRPPESRETLAPTTWKSGPRSGSHGPRGLSCKYAWPRRSWNRRKDRCVSRTIDQANNPPKVLSPTMYTNSESLNTPDSTRAAAIPAAEASTAATGMPFGLSRPNAFGAYPPRASEKSSRAAK